MVRTYVLTDKQRSAVESYLEEMPKKMPPIIKQIRHKLYRTDLDKMMEDISLLKVLKEMDIPIGRGKDQSWIDQRGKFTIRKS